MRARSPFLVVSGQWQCYRSTSTALVQLYSQQPLLPPLLALLDLILAAFVALLVALLILSLISLLFSISILSFLHLLLIQQ